MSEVCSICKRLLDDPQDPTTENCGGDCLRCMAEFAEDPDCMAPYIRILKTENKYLRHDLERQMTIANEHVNEVERLRAEAEARYDRGYYDGCTRQLTHRNVSVAAAPADRIGGGGGLPCSVVSVAKDPAAEWQSGYEAGVEAAAKALEADARLCDCLARVAGECGCGAWCEWKLIRSARAVEIVRKLADTP